MSLTLPVRGKRPELSRDNPSRAGLGPARVAADCSPWWSVTPSNGQHGTLRVSEIRTSPHVLRFLVGYTSFPLFNRFNLDPVNCSYGSSFMISGHRGHPCLPIWLDRAPPIVRETRTNSFLKTGQAISGP